jgi:hypothetical protein
VASRMEAEPEVQEWAPEPERQMSLF